MAAGEEFTRAKCVSTGAIAALPAEAVKLGHIPGWEAVDGPLPEIPKPNAFPAKVEDAPTEPQVEDESTTEPPPPADNTQTAGSSSAKKRS